METVTFSRALHLMRNARSKVRYAGGWEEGQYLYYHPGQDTLIIHYSDGREFVLDFITPRMALGSWEVL